MKLYALLLRLYPRRFREAHGEAMRQLYADLWSVARHDGWRGRFSFVRRIVVDAMRSIPAEHLREITHRRRHAPSTRSRRTMFVESFATDIRHALRTLVRMPGFAFAAVATVAIGIGAVTAMFGVVDGVLLRPLPYRGDGALVQIGMRFGDVQVASVSPVDYADLRERSRTVARFAVSRLQRMDLAGTGEAEWLTAAGVSHAFFPALGVAPAHGRGFREIDDTRAAEAVVVLSHGLWQRRFGGDPAVLGTTLTLSGSPWVVVGIMPAGFRGPEAIYQDDVELWLPLGRIDDPLDDRGDAFVQMIARLMPGVELESAQSELRAIGERIGSEFPETGVRSYWVADLRERTVRDAGVLLWTLLGAVSLLLLIACANVANLLLVRAGDRTREFAVRGALGAGRWRMARQLLTESLVLSLVGAVAGIGLAQAAIVLFRRLVPEGVPRVAEVVLDLRVLGFALAVAVLTGVLFGLAPALQSAGRDIASRLREAGLAVSGARRGHRLRAAFVTLQTALALVLLTGAGLLLNTWVRLASVETGFASAGVAWVNIDLPDRRYETADARLAFFDLALERVRALPGVHAAGAIHGMPLDHNRSLSTMLPEGQLLQEGERPPRLPFHSVLPGYFASLDIPIVEGRDVTDADRAGSERVAVVSQAFARRFWPDRPAVGQRFRLGNLESAASAVTVVGVAGDVRHHGLAQEPEPLVYLPFAQFPHTWVAVTVRHSGEPAPLLRALRAEIQALDPWLPVDEFGTMRDRVAGMLVAERFRTALLATFAAIALLLTAIGLYGTMAHVVRARRRELGIRLALGARAGDVHRLVVRRGMAIVAAGLGLGLAVALVATRTLSSFLFGLSATDPLTFLAGSAFLAVVALTACWIPARRAAAVDPATTLRDE